MSFFNTTATLQHTTPLPAGVSKSQAVARLLHDHPFFVRCGPHSVDWTRVDAEEQRALAEAALDEHESGEHPLPAAVEAVIAASLDTGSGFEVFRVTDVVHTLPAGLWDSNVVSTYEMTDTASGVHVRIRSPLSIVMDTAWAVAEDEDGALALVEENVIYCSRLLIGTVRGLCETGRQAIHDNMLKRIGEDMGTA